MSKTEMSKTNNCGGHGWERAVEFLWGEASRMAEFWPSRDVGRAWRDLSNEVHGMAIFAIWQGCEPDVIETLELLEKIAYERSRMDWKPARRAAV